MKKKLRDKYKQLRSKLPQHTRENYSEHIFKKIYTNFNLIDKNISVFLPITKFHEINTWHLINRVDASYYLPVVKNKELKHIKFENRNQLKISEWGIEEPTYGIEVQPDKFDFVIIPLLAYDHLGNRIGYGAGFYDNFLKHCNKNCKFIGVSFFDPEAELIETYETDIPLHFCATPNKLIKF